MVQVWIGPVTPHRRKDTEVSNIVLGDVSFTGPSGNGWGAVGVNDSSTQSPYIQAIALCAS
jgi:hypothetical protein